MDVQYIGTTNYGRHWLDRPAADSWFRMVRDGCPPQGITDAGRTYQEQVNVFLAYFTTDYASSAKFDRREWNGNVYWRRKGKPSAATPGSIFARHTTGLALDLNGSTKAWVRANGHRYGWIKDVVKGEDWHMEYQQYRDVVLVTNPGTSVPKPPTGPAIPDPIEPIEPILPKEDEMWVLRDTSNGKIWYVSSTAYVPAYDTAEVSAVLTMLNLPPVGGETAVDPFTRTRIFQAIDRLKKASQ